MLNTWKKKFNTKNFSLTHNEPIKFLICQWQVKDDCPSVWYLIYRWLIAIYFFVTWSLTIILAKQNTLGFRAKWLIYLTNWGYTTCTFQAFLAAFMLSLYILSNKLKNNEKLSDKALKYYGIYWVTNTIATVVACGITIIYWTTIYDKKKNNLDAINFFVHAMNTIIMTLDFWIVSHSVRFAHCIYPIIFATIYAIFSFIYYLFGGTSRDGTTYIYPILKWDMPMRSILVCLSVGLFFLLIHGFFYLMYRLKITIHGKLYQRKCIEIKTTVNATKGQDGYINEAMIIGDQV